MPPLTVLAILGIAVVMTLVAMRVDKVGLFAPKKTSGVRGSAQAFCLDHCRTDEGECPLELDPKDCPLWHYVEADMETDLRFDSDRPVEKPHAAAIG